MMANSKSLPFIGIILGSTLAVLLIFSFLFYVGLQNYISQLFEWLSQQGYWAVLLFIVIDCAAVILLLPSLFFTVEAGFLFGFFKGVVIVVSGTVLGASIAFILARYFFNQSFKMYLRKHKRFSLFNQELVSDGWKIILISRLIPFFPFKLSNYFFGTADYKYSHFLFGTLIGIVPITAFNVYLGSMASDISRVMNWDDIASSPFLGWFYGLGFLMAIVLLTTIFHSAQKSLARYNQLTIDTKKVDINASDTQAESDES